MCSLGNEDRQPISEGADDESFLPYLRLRSPRLERKPDVELDACSARHLRHPMSPVDHVQDAFYVRLAMQRWVQRRVPYACS